MGRMSLEFIRAQFAEPEAEPQHVYWDLFDTLEGIKEPVLRLRVLESVAFTSGGMALAQASSYVFEVRKLMEENVPLQEIASAIRTEEWHRTVQGFRAPLTDLSHLLSFRTRVIDAAHVAAAAIGKKARIKSLDDMIKDEEVRSLKGDQIVNLKLIAEMTCDNPEDVEDVHKSLVDSQNAQARHWVATRKMMAPATTWVIEQAQALWESGNFFELDEETRQRLVVHATNAVDRATSDLAISRITPIAFALILNEARALKRELAAN
jgi:hypothetical protein